jgi:membrane protease YdiL (CAAX protease family)
LIVTAALGVLFGLLVVRFGSIWPAILAHLMHNTISLLSLRTDGLKPFLTNLGLALDEQTGPSDTWVLGALAVTAFGVCICLFWPTAAPREGSFGKLAVRAAGSTDSAG